MSEDQTPVEPPVADRRHHSYSHHGVTIEDPYHWLKDPGYPQVDDPHVLAYLEAENAYFESMMAPRGELVDTLFEEIKARQKPDDSGVPFKDGDWHYRWRFEEGGQYRIWQRWPARDGETPDSPGANAETLLNEPELAAEHEYFRLGALSVSHGGDLLAYSTDTDGSERYRLFVKDLSTGELLEDEIENTLGGAVWAADDSALLYVVVDENWRPYQVRRHVLGQPVESDSIIYEEHDPGFFVRLSESASELYILIHAAGHTSSEAYVIPAGASDAEPLLVAPRRADHEYFVDHQEDRFVIRTNDRHRNFRLVTAAGDDPSEDNWVSLLEGSAELYIRGFDVFADFIAVVERTNGLNAIRLIGRDGTTTHVELPETVCSVSLGDNAEFRTRTLRLEYSSMITPPTVFDYRVDSGELKALKIREIPSGYAKEQYLTERLMAPARDGAEIPVSLVRRKDTPADAGAPLYLYGYGAYGFALPPSFSTSRLSLLDRGFIFAIAHIRGGDDLGYHWYEAGKLDRRTNTFNDFVDVARFLIEAGYAGKGRIAIAGGSAGGELMGAVVNQAPELWGAVAAHLPFVDVLNTMLDESLPLTPTEWPEWGNPIEDKAAFELIRSYSPYDQLAAREYPPMLVTAGLNDPRVTYWEPAKYVARLRHLKTGDSPLLLKTNMGAGHGGRSGRYDSLYEVAEEYAFMLWSLGLAD
ncbi:MAG: S9 family peptidase [Gammaproteobacteria bacterium]|nr:S9 family peptidase [Gammaproteobacteria bacterium]MYF57590.1 S9 family peptidase [Gammaproteobacteria bacterium]